jgi:hypothetical protein
MFSMQLPLDVLRIQVFATQSMGSVNNFYCRSAPTTPRFSHGVVDVGDVIFRRILIAKVNEIQVHHLPHRFQEGDLESEAVFSGYNFCCQACDG